jgi:RimJ/RimL family protein N-acetyltransferase
MPYTFTPIQREEAQSIAGWRYDGPYALYDGDPDGFETLLRPEYRVHAARDEHGELIGYCSFGEDARVAGYAYADDALDVGLGMRPDLVGRSRGIGFTRAVLDFAQREFRPDAFRVTIAAFNRRAQRLCLALGFRETGRFLRQDSKDEFVVYRREPARQPG